MNEFRGTEIIDDQINADYQKQRAINKEASEKIAALSKKEAEAKKQDMLDEIKSEQEKAEAAVRKKHKAAIHEEAMNKAWLQVANQMTE